jgi:DNA polymerase-3 subunit chi
MAEAARAATEAIRIECGFYHLTRTALEPALGRLLEKVVASGHRALVKASSPERVDALNRALWTFDPASFVPHGTATDGDPEQQPILLSTDDEAPNGADVLVLVDGAEADPSAPFARCLYLFDGRDKDAVADARLVWRRWREAGMKLVYWQQGERGWERAMATD